MRLDDALDDAEAEPVAADLTGLRFGAAIERLEDMRQIGWRDAEAPVTDGDAHRGAAAPVDLRRGHANPPPRPAVLQRVGDQVLQARPQPHGIGEDRRQIRRDVGFHRRLRFFNRVRRRGERVANERRHRHRCAMADAPAGFDTGVEQHALDGIAKPARFGLDAGPVLLDARRIGDEAVGEVLRRRPDDRDRRAQLVRDGRDELHLLPHETRGAIRGAREHCDAREHEQQDAEAEDQVAHPRGFDGRLERPGAVPRDQRPPRLVVERQRLAAGVRRGPPRHADEQAAPAIGAGWHRVAQRVGGQADELELIRVEREEVDLGVVPADEGRQVVDVGLVDGLRSILPRNDRDPVLVAGLETEVLVHQRRQELVFHVRHVEPDQRVAEDRLVPGQVTGVVLNWESARSARRLSRHRG